MKSKVLNKLFEGRNVIMEVDDYGKLWFEVESLSMAIGYITKTKGKEYVHKSRMNKTLKNAEISTVVHGVQQWITEQQMYDFLIEAHTEKSKVFKKWVTDDILPTIEKTGAYIEEGREQEMVNYYFSALLSDLQGKIVNELIEKNKELQQFYDDLMNTEGLMDINTVAKELGIGEYKLFARMREMGILFKNENNDNVVYEKPVHKGKFICVPAIAPDGTAHLQTRVYPEGISYITKLLRKYGYLEVA